MPGLNDDVLDAGLAQLVDQRDGLVELGDAGGDDDAVDRRAGGAGTLHEALLPELQLPQVGVEEQRVELVACGPASSRSSSSATRSAKICSVTCPPPASSAQKPALAAAATIFGVDGGRRHAGQQHRRLAGQAGEARSRRGACRRAG